MKDMSECDLVEQARIGDARSIELLTVEVQRRVRAYGNRVLLDAHGADDLAQDTVAAVLRSLGNFRQVDRFWPWVFTIATNQIRENFRRQRLRNTVPMSHVNEIELQSPSDADEGSAALAREELAELARKAMSQVGDRHRMVLALRFYEDLSHAEIARAMGCSELTARVVFHRAKLILTRELKKLGVNKTMLTAALAAFGCMTLGRSAQGMTVSVSSAAASEGVLTGWVMSHIKTVTAAAIMISLLTGWWLLSVQAKIPNRVKQYGPPLHVHMISRGPNIAFQTKAILTDRWFYFPQGVGGPFLTCVQPIKHPVTQPYEWELITKDGHYQFISKEKVAERRDAMPYCSELHTQCLPTDSQDFSEFIHLMDGENSHAYITKMGYRVERDKTTTFVTGGEDSRTPNDTFNFTVSYEPPKGFDPFQFQLPAGWSLVDKRDTMHKRGWTFFRIEGTLWGENVSGIGRVPLVYESSLTYLMWVKMNVGNRLLLQDEGSQAVVRDSNGMIMAVYPGGTFFRGLTRAWEGFHTLDSIRRDAAVNKLAYRVGSVESNIVHLTVTKGEDDDSKLWAEYTVDTQHDLLSKLRYSRGAGAGETGELTFIYLDEVDPTNPEFASPEPLATPSSVAAGSSDLFWPVEVSRLKPSVIANSQPSVH